MKRWITLIYTTVEFSVWLRYQDKVKHKNQWDEIIATLLKKKKVNIHLKNFLKTSKKMTSKIEKCANNSSRKFMEKSLHD